MERAGADDRGRRGDPGEPLRGGELNAAVTRALVGIQTAFLGRGPDRAVTFHHGNVVVTLMSEVMSRAERMLAAGDRSDAVTELRLLAHGTMEGEFRAAVERLTGRAVVAFVTGYSSAHDLASGVFVLDRPL